PAGEQCGDEALRLVHSRAQRVVRGACRATIQVQPERDAETGGTSVVRPNQATSPWPPGKFTRQGADSVGAEPAAGRSGRSQRWILLPASTATRRSWRIMRLT